MAAQPVTFDAKVVNLQVKATKHMVTGEDGVKREQWEKIGKLTLEFDGEAVDATEIAQLIHGANVGLQIENTQLELFQSKAAAEG